jgi:hypothetical protein
VHVQCPGNQRWQPAVKTMNGNKNILFFHGTGQPITFFIKSDNVYGLFSQNSTIQPDHLIAHDLSSTLQDEKYENRNNESSQLEVKPKVT